MEECAAQRGGTAVRLRCMAGMPCESCALALGGGWWRFPRKLPERHVSFARRCRYVVVKLVAERNLHVVFQKAHAAGGLKTGSIR